MHGLENYVVQRYIDNPFLLQGLKFDFRVYVLLTSCDPLYLFIYKEGLARLATKKYTKPNTANIEDTFVHLTNYSINKHSEEFKFNLSAKDDNIGHKRSMSSVFKVHLLIFNHLFNFLYISCCNLRILRQNRSGETSKQ